MPHGRHEKNLNIGDPVNETVPRRGSAGWFGAIPSAARFQVSD
jgi:hypothetical protein